MLKIGDSVWLSCCSVGSGKQFGAFWPCSLLAGPRGEGREGSGDDRAVRNGKMRNHLQAFS